MAGEVLSGRSVVDAEAGTNDAIIVAAEGAAGSRGRGRRVQGLLGYGRTHDAVRVCVLVPTVTLIALPIFNWHQHVLEAPTPAPKLWNIALAS